MITRDQVVNGWQKSARDEAAGHVERILDRLPGREREFLDAMIALPTEERSLKNIAPLWGSNDQARSDPSHSDWIRTTKSSREERSTPSVTVRSRRIFPATGPTTPDEPRSESWNCVQRDLSDGLRRNSWGN